MVEVDLIAQRARGYIQRYHIQLMPTQVFFDANGDETGRHMGKISGEDIWPARAQGGRAMTGARRPGGGASVGGVLTSASPCVLAAVPVAVGYVGGQADQAASGLGACRWPSWPA